MNANSNHSKEIQSLRNQIQIIRSIQMQILTIRMGFEAFEAKFAPFTRNSKHSIGNSSNSKRIRRFRNQSGTTRKVFDAFEWKFEPFVRDSKLSKPNSNHSKGIRSFWNQIRTIRNSKEIWSIRMKIRNIWTKFEGFETKFERFKMVSKHLNGNSNHSKWIWRFRNQRPSLIAGLDCGLDRWTGLLDWITGSNQTASKSDDACVVDWTASKAKV